MKDRIFITFILALLCGITVSAQEYYLKINDTKGSYVAYPPGTKFVLKDKSDYIIFKETSDPEKFDISEGKKLIVYPSYKSSKDTYHIKKGMIEFVPTATWPNVSETSFSDHDYAGGLKLKKTYSKSERYPGTRNVELSFSNGVKFTYEDGRYSATQNEKELEIKGKYLIQSNEGVIKLSYNNESGTVWWVFEPK